MTCVPSEDSDQPGIHLASLISLCCPYEETLGPYLSTECIAKTLSRLGGCPGCSESLLGAQIILLIWLCCGSFVIELPNISGNKEVHILHYITVLYNMVWDITQIKVGPQIAIYNFFPI